MADKFIKTEHFHSQVVTESHGNTFTQIAGEQPQRPTRGDTQNYHHSEDRSLLLQGEASAPDRKLSATWRRWTGPHRKCHSRGGGGQGHGGQHQAEYGAKFGTWKRAEAL